MRHTGIEGEHRTTPQLSDCLFVLVRDEFVKMNSDLSLLLGFWFLGLNSLIYFSIFLRDNGILKDFSPDSELGDIGSQTYITNYKLPSVMKTPSELLLLL